MEQSEKPSKEYPKILIACPTFDGKMYCLDRWVAAVNKIDYPHFDVLLVDNSSGEGYAKRIKQLGIPVLRSHRHERARDTITEARNLIRKKALDGKYDYLFSLEQDVIPKPETLKKLLTHD